MSRAARGCHAPQFYSKRKLWAFSSLVVAASGLIRRASGCWLVECSSLRLSPSVCPGYLILRQPHQSLHNMAQCIPRSGELTNDQPRSQIPLHLQTLVRNWWHVLFSKRMKAKHRSRLHRPLIQSAHLAALDPLPPRTSGFQAVHTETKASACTQGRTRQRSAGCTRFLFFAGA